MGMSIISAANPLATALPNLGSTLAATTGTGAETPGAMLEAQYRALLTPTAQSQAITSKLTPTLGWGLALVLLSLGAVAMLGGTSPAGVYEKVSGTVPGAR